MKSIIALAFAMLFTNPSFADINVSPTSLMFGSVKVDGFGYHQQVSYVRNTGDKTENIQVSGFCPQDFRVSHNCYSLPKYGQCQISVQFRPTRAGYHSCSYSVRGSTGMTTFLNISGTGLK
ncbi:MAG: hypothetical protein V4596_02850 [Bdellovibrionota bacterium]